jgi:hypothetical protein
MMIEMERKFGEKTGELPPVCLVIAGDKKPCKSDDGEQAEQLRHLMIRHSYAIAFGEIVSATSGGPNAQCPLQPELLSIAFEVMVIENHSRNLNCARFVSEN